MQATHDSHRRSKVMEILIFLALLIGVALLQIWLLPKLGIRA
jgi:hypothetical protein